MELREFANKVVEALAEEHDSLFEIKEIIKNNGTKVTGIIIRADKNTVIAPTIYIDDCYVRGLSVDATAEKVWERYENSMKNDITQIDPNKFLNFDSVRNDIVFQLINTEHNKALLTDLPHVDWNDLSIIFEILVQSEECLSANIKITNDMLKSWNLDINELYSMAAENTPKLAPGVVQNIAGALKEMNLLDEDDLDFDVESVPMFVLSNKTKINGAGVLLYPEVLKKFSDMIQGDYYILPSSIHETILLPDKENDHDIEYLKNMVYEINRTQVDACEVLSDSVYKYCRDTDTVIVC